MIVVAGKLQIIEKDEAASLEIQGRHDMVGRLISRPAGVSRVLGAPMAARWLLACCCAIFFAVARH